MNDRQIINEISVCFKETNHPGNEHVIQPDSMAIQEALEVKRIFGTVKWDQLDIQTLLKQKEALNFFSDQAFIYE